jgi:hypothetical protein
MLAVLAIQSVVHASTLAGCVINLSSLRVADIHPKPCDLRVGSASALACRGSLRRWFQASGGRSAQILHRKSLAV